MAIIGMRDVSWGFGGTPLFENITFQVEKGERVCLLGRNGAGKSSLFRMISGDIRPDTGEIWQQPTTVVSGLGQEVPRDFEGTLFDVAAGGLGSLEEMDPQDKYERLRQVDSILSKTGLDPDNQFADLSAGMKRRALFARALAGNPDVLLLDEPTNHLDIEAIIWMEQFLLRNVQTMLFITHDRAFLKKVATRIMELDRGRLLSFDCDYDTYLSRRQALFAAEEKEQARFDQKLSQEEAWIRQGIKARRTRNEGRVRALEKMREAHRAQRGLVGNVKMQVQEAEKSGKLVIEARSISCRYDERPIVSDFSTLIMRGDRVGIIGPNGAGKTTLLNLLLQKINPDSGHVRHGTKLKTAYFDQLRGELDETKTVAQNIAEGNDFVEFNGEKRHVISYLKDFLFSPERCRTPVHVLSGGEKNRLLLARLFTRPANLLVMDEPTNDLDVETLELLEDLLFNFNGTVLLVSHDRAFLNNVVTSTIVFEDTGEVIEYAGGYDDWLIQRGKRVVKQEKVKTPEKPKSKPKPQRAPRLGFKQMRELEALPREIEAMEAEHSALYEQMSDPEFYKKGSEEIARVKDRLEELEKAIEYAYDRWEALENRS